MEFDAIACDDARRVEDKWRFAPPKHHLDGP